MNPPMDPPPFEDLPIQMCTTINVQINNYRGAREVYVPWPAVRTVQSWLSELFN